METKYAVASKPSLLEQIENINKKLSDGAEGGLEMFAFLKKMKTIPIFSVLNTTEGGKKGGKRKPNSIKNRKEGAKVKQYISWQSEDHVVLKYRKNVVKKKILEIKFR